MKNALLAAGLFLLNVALNPPLFMRGEGVYRDSIEGGYASMSRFIAAHPNPWGWNPYQYCGLPTQFTYLPGLPYLTAMWIRLFPSVEPEYVYRLVTSTLACLGPVTLFLFALYFTRNRWWAVATALAYTLFSPAYGLIQQIDNDRGIVPLPWRLQLLVKYGEGPHNSGLTLMPVALMAVWAAGVGRKSWQMVAAAAALAAVVLTNWIAAMALAFCCGMMLLAGVGTQRVTGFQPLRPLIAAGLAYLFAAFWLTPTFVKTIAFNWPADAFSYRLGEAQVKLLAGLAAGLLLLRLPFLKFARQSYLCFLVLCGFGYGYVVLNFYWNGANTLPESRRYTIEFEMFLFLLLFEFFRVIFLSRFRALHMGAIGVAAVLLWMGAGQTWAYATRDNRKWRPIPKEETIEYQLAKRIADRQPVGRVFASGGVRFRLNSWFDLQQIGGSFESGLRNRTPVHYAYQIRTGIGSEPGRDGHDAVKQLRAMGVEYIVVHGPKSKEPYRDYRNPGKFEGLLEAVYREGDDAIYRRPVVSLAHLVRPAELPEEAPMGGYVHYMDGYLAAVDDPQRPRLKTTWRGASELHVEGPVYEGMVVSLAVSYDPGWDAEQDGRPVAIEPDLFGFMTLRPRPAAATRIELRYRGTPEQRLMAGVSLLAWLGALGWVVVRRRPAESRAAG